MDPHKLEGFQELHVARPLRIGVVGLPGGWSSEALKTALIERTGWSLLVDMGRVGLNLDSGRACFEGVELNALDGLVIKKIHSDYSPALLDRLEILRAIEASGVRIFSPPRRVSHMINRLSCTVTLRGAGIPMPGTVISEDLDVIEAAVRRFGQGVLKPLFTSKARGMELVSDGPGLRQQLSAYQSRHSMFYLQKRIPLPGRDLGLAFLGGELVGTYARVAGKDSWNTTVLAGGHYASHTPAPETVEVARRAQGLFGLDFASVDVVEAEDGPQVFEVSAFGGFRGLRDGAGINAAGLVADYVIEKLYEAMEEGGDPAE